MKTIIIALVMSLSLFAGEYKIDKPHTNLNFEVEHITISIVTGRFDDFDGTFSYDENKNIPTAIDGIVQIASINTGTEMRDNHLKTADFFDAKTYPTMKFKMTGFRNGKLIGNLTIKDITKEVVFDYVKGKTVVDPWGKAKAGFGLIGEINRFDFNINYKSLFGDNLPSVGKTIKIAVNMEGYKQ